jgi:hypothetical protein
MNSPASSPALAFLVVILSAAKDLVSAPAFLFVIPMSEAEGNPRLRDRPHSRHPERSAAQSKDPDALSLTQAL